MKVLMRFNFFSDDEGDLVTQVKCPKSYKPLFTVIKNVKKGHELNDQGEDQEFQAGHSNQSCF